MSYRFVKISNFYPQYLADFYHRHPEINGISYQDHLKTLMLDGFAWADYYSQQLRTLGVDAHEIVANSEPLSRAWAKESGFTGDSSSLLFAQIAALRPDVVFIQDPFGFGANWIKELKERVPSVRKVLGWYSVPFSSEQLLGFKAYDALLTCALEFVPIFEKAGIRAYHLHHAFEPSLLSRLSGGTAEPELDFVFLGSLMFGRGMHNERMELLEGLLSDKEIQVQIYSNLSANSWAKTSSQQIAYLLYQVGKELGLDNFLKRLAGFKKVSRWTEFPKRHTYSERVRAVAQPPVYGLKMFEVLRKSRIGFNSHIDCAGRFAANVRMFEVTGVGSCLLTDWKENMHELFELDREVVTYRSVDECLDKVKWLLSNPKECADIAKAGQRRCLRDHTFEKRALELHSIILKELKEKA